MAGNSPALPLTLLSAPTALQRRDRNGANPPQPKTPTVSDWVTANLQLTPDNLQAEVLDATEDSVLLLCTRQWGKSTIAAAKAIHHALTTPKAFILVASASKRQSTELVRKFKEFAEMIGLKTKRDGEGFTLPNRARIIPVPQSPAKVRCYSAPTLIIIDEAAFVDDEMFEAVTPMLATSNGSPLAPEHAQRTTRFLLQNMAQPPGRLEVRQSHSRRLPAHQQSIPRRRKKRQGRSQLPA